MLDHLRSRHYEPDAYRHQWIDFENRVLSVPLFNLSGVMVGFQQYRPDTKEKPSNHPSEARYYTYSRGSLNAYWGLETYDRRKRHVFVVEGIFKAAVLHRLGHNAIAVLGCNPRAGKTFFDILAATHDVIAIGDNDLAGQSLVDFVGKGFLSDDMDEMSLEVVDKILLQKVFTR